MTDKGNALRIVFGGVAEDPFGRLLELFDDVRQRHIGTEIVIDHEDFRVVFNERFDCVRRRVLVHALPEASMDVHNDRRIFRQVDAVDVQLLSKTVAVRKVQQAIDCVTISIGNLKSD